MSGDSSSITLPEVVNTATPVSSSVSALQAPYASRKIDLTFTLGTGDFGISGLNQLTFSGLRVYAHLVNVIFPHMASECLIRVYGMSLNHMKQLSVAGLLYEGRKNNTVQVSAGDDTSGMTTVANATIVEAYPNLNGAADERHFYVYASGIIPEIQLKPTTPSSYPGSVPVSQILQTLVGQVGYTLQNNSVNATLAQPYFWGTIWQQIQSCVRAADCFAYLDTINRILIIWPKNAAPPSNTTVTVSPATGMIGYPEFEMTRIIVRTLFSPMFAVGPGGTVLVQSTLGAANNAMLTLNLVVHDLASQLPGGPWMTTLVGTPPLGVR